MWTADVAYRAILNLPGAEDGLKASAELSYEALYHEAPHVEDASEAPVPNPLLRLCPGLRDSRRSPRPYLS